MLLKIFDEDSVLSKDAMTNFLNYLEDLGEKRSMVYIHSTINVLYLCFVLGYNKCFKEALYKFGYKRDLFIEGFDPLLEALKINNPLILDLFADYF